MSSTYQPHIPSALRRAEADLLNQMQTAQGQTQPQEAQPPEPSPDDATVLEPMPGDQGDGQPEGAPAGVHADGQNPPPLDQAGQPPAPAEPQAGDDTWEQRYRVLQGKYNAEIGRLTSSLRLMESLVQRLQPQAHAGDAAAAGAAGPAAEPPRPPSEDLSDDELKRLVGDEQALEEFGPDFFRTVAKFQRRLQPKQDAPDLAPLRAEVEQLRRERLESGLDRILPTWRRQNADARFVDWMRQTPEPRTGMSYLDVLRGALSRGDLQGVATVFQDWPGARPSGQPGQAPRVPVTQQVTVRPAGGAGAPPNAPAVKKTYTQDQVMALAKQIATGEVSGDRAKALQADLEAAFADGRVR